MGCMFYRRERESDLVLKMRSHQTSPQKEKMDRTELKNNWSVTKSKEIYCRNMISKIWIFCFIILLNIFSFHSSEIGWVFRERTRTKFKDLSFIPKRRSDINAIHRVVFVVQLRNLDILDEVLQNVSDPNHVDYGKHWTKDQIGDLIRNIPAEEAIETYMRQKGLQILTKTPNGEFIEVQGPIHKWESIFATKFHQYECNGCRFKASSSLINRAESYSLPIVLNHFIESVFHVVNFPVDQQKSLSTPYAVETSVPFANNPTTALGYVSIPLLNSQYSIFTNEGNSLTTQSAFECIGQTLSPSDLALFQNYFGLPSQKINASFGGHVNNNACNVSIYDCDEANLDFQYLMGVAQKIPTISLYEENCDYSTFFASLKNPPKVISISYGGYEALFGVSYVTAFNTVAKQLGVMGVTIVVSSGDDGVSGWKTKTSADCGYNSQFPASSPYVLTIGATQGPEFGNPEVACQGNRSGVITSGGGFSVFNTLPTYQYNAVNNYFAAIRGTKLDPISGYATTARGYPDISAMGHTYPVILNRRLYYFSGTSASAPVVAAMISLVNAARKARGLSTMGYINPFIYLNSKLLTKDITSGNNFCIVRGKVCCRQGFYATNGWDPVTGLGVLNFENFYALAVSGSLRPSARPTIFPTAAPSNIPTISPTPSPTQVPTFSPTLSPTFIPTEIPSPIPTFYPTLSPSTITPTYSFNPSMIPSIAPRVFPTRKPSFRPSSYSSWLPTLSPTALPSFTPSINRTPDPTTTPTKTPTRLPTFTPSRKPSPSPTLTPSRKPSPSPTLTPSRKPSPSPTLTPSRKPSPSPTLTPSRKPSPSPTLTPSKTPTIRPSTRKPTF